MFTTMADQIKGKYFFGHIITETSFEKGMYVVTCIRDGIDPDKGKVMGRLMDKCLVEGIYFSTQASKTYFKYRISFECFGRVKELYDEAEKEHFALKAFSGLGD